MGRCQEIYTTNYSKVHLSHILIKSIQILDLVQGVVSTFLKCFSMWLASEDLASPSSNPNLLLPCQPFLRLPNSTTHHRSTLLLLSLYFCDALNDATQLPYIDFHCRAANISAHRVKNSSDATIDTQTNRRASVRHIVGLDKLTSHDAPTSWLFLI
jgi:hypothetical protein